MNSKSSSKVTLHRKTAKLQRTSLGKKTLLDYAKQYFVHFNSMSFHYLLLYFVQVSMYSGTAKKCKQIFSLSNVKYIGISTYSSIESEWYLVVII